MFSPDNFQGYTADYSALNNSRTLHQSSTTLDSFYRPPFYCPPFVHWLPGQYAVEDFRGAGASIGKHRRNRTAFSQQQLAVLESSFSDTQYPDLETRDRLSRATSLPETKIQVWFKNRRAKCRKLQKANDKTSSHASSSSHHGKDKEDISSTSPLLPSPTKKQGKFSYTVGKISGCTMLDAKDDDSDVSVGGSEKPEIHANYIAVTRPPVSFDLADKQVTEGKESLLADKKPSLSMRSTEVLYDGSIMSQPLNLTLPPSQSSLCHRQNPTIPFLNNLDPTSRYLPWMYSSLTNPWPLVYYGAPSNLYSPSGVPRHHPLLSVPSAAYSDRITTEETNPIDFVPHFDDKRLS